MVLTSVPAGRFLNTSFNNCCTRSFSVCVESVELVELELPVDDELLVDVVEELLLNDDNSDERPLFDESLAPPIPPDDGPVEPPLGGGPNSLCNLETSIPLAVRT